MTKLLPHEVEAIRAMEALGDDAVAEAMWAELEAQMQQDAALSVEGLHPDDPVAQRLARPHHQALRRLLGIGPDDPGDGELMLVLFVDRRALIRRDRGYVGQAGPPPDPKTANGPTYNLDERSGAAADEEATASPVFDTGGSNPNPLGKSFNAHFRANALARPRRGRR